MDFALPDAMLYGTPLLLMSAYFAGQWRTNRDRVMATQARGQLRVLMESRVKEIKPDAVVIEHDSTIQTLPNDFVVVCVGGLLPTPFLHSAGIQVEAKFGTA